MECSTGDYTGPASMLPEFIDNEHAAGSEHGALESTGVPVGPPDLPTMQPAAASAALPSMAPPAGMPLPKIVPTSKEVTMPKTTVTSPSPPVLASSNLKLGQSTNDLEY